MTRAELLFFVNPLSIGLNLLIKQRTGEWVIKEVLIDTGAEYGLMPFDLLEPLEHRITAQIEVEQAGLAGHYFAATLAEISVKIADQAGRESRILPVQVMFADTDIYLVGFEGFLNEAVMCMDVPNRTGYLEIK